MKEFGGRLGPHTLPTLWRFFHVSQLFPSSLPL